MPASTGFEPQRYRRIEPFFTRRSTASEAANISSFAAECDLALGIVAQQLTPEQGKVRRRSFVRKVDRPPRDVGILVKDDAQQTDEGCLRHGRPVHLTPR